MVPSQEDGNKKTCIQRWTGIEHLQWVRIGLELPTLDLLREFINIEGPVGTERFQHLSLICVSPPKALMELLSPVSKGFNGNLQS